MEILKCTLRPELMNDCNIMHLINKLAAELQHSSLMRTDLQTLYAYVIPGPPAELAIHNTQALQLFGRMPHRFRYSPEIGLTFDEWLNLATFVQSVRKPAHDVAPGSTNATPLDQ